jgi:uncharacterized protein
LIPLLSTDCYPDGNSQGNIIENSGKMKAEILTPPRRDPALAGKCAMGIMIKTPRNGFSKTRLCPPFSSEEAASISRCFLKDTSSTINALSRADPFVVGVAVYTPVGSESELGELLAPGFKMIAQRETDFGDRLSGAIEDLFSVGFAAVCVINSDSPTLPLQHLQDLATFLEKPTDRLVIGPSLDGGYYALGLRHVHTRLFEEITWNTNLVYRETIERANQIDLPAISLPAWYDVDDQLSLNRLLAELFSEYPNKAAPQGAPAPNTKEFLREILVREGAGRICPQMSSSMRTV